jgi:hypothetical protein
MRIPYSAIDSQQLFFERAQAQDRIRVHSFMSNLIGRKHRRLHGSTSWQYFSIAFELLSYGIVSLSLQNISISGLFLEQQPILDQQEADFLEASRPPSGRPIHHKDPHCRRLRILLEHSFIHGCASTRGFPRSSVSACFRSSHYSVLEISNRNGLASGRSTP